MANVKHEEKSRKLLSEKFRERWGLSLREAQSLARRILRAAQESSRDALQK